MRTSVRADDIFWLSNSLKEIPKLSERIFAELKSVKVREPSILDFSINEANIESGSSELPEGAIIEKAMICDKNSFPIRYQAIVYFNNKWHLSITNPGT